MKDISEYVERLIEEKGLEALSPEVLVQLKSDLSDRVEDRVNAAILAELPEDKLGDFNNVLDQGDQDKIQEFCKKNIPDLEALVAAQLLSFRQTYLGL